MFREFVDNTPAEWDLLVNSKAPWMAETERWTPAHQAVEVGGYEVLAVLLGTGADPMRCVSAIGCSLMPRCRGRRSSAVVATLNTVATAILLACGADPRLPTDDGQTPCRSLGRTPAPSPPGSRSGAPAPGEGMRTSRETT